MKKRMYFLVIYQLSGHQAGIQAGHCAQKYDRKYKDDDETLDFIDNHQTWYVMNGGDVNEGSNLLMVENETGQMVPYVGVINKDIAKLEAIGYKYATFREPSLGDLITACGFICDERVFNKDEYPDFSFPNFEKWSRDYQHLATAEKLKESYEVERTKAYQQFVTEVGVDVATLKEILKGKRFHGS